MSEPKDPVVLQRQINCKHSMIVSHNQTICVHCGVEAKDLEGLIVALLWSGMGGGIKP
jgi:hypothetical protein